MLDPVQTHRAAQQYLNYAPASASASASANQRQKDILAIPDIYSVKKSNALINFLLVNAIVSNLRIVHPCPPHRPHASLPTRHPRKVLQHCISSAHDMPVRQTTDTAKEPPFTLRRHSRPAASSHFFPMAEATPSATHGTSAQWDSEHQIMTVKDDASKAGLISALRLFLINQGISSERAANQLEFELRQRAADAELSIAPAAQQHFFSRDKRISQATREKNIAAHIKENCAFETEIINTQGGSEGRVLLIQAQRAENPFHWLLENKDGEAPNEWVRYASNGMNFVADVATFGIKPIMGNLLAAYLRKQHYQQQGDQICATRNLHLMFAEIASALSVEGLPLRASSRQLHHKPLELNDNILGTSQAAYFARNKNTGVQTEVFITAKASHDTDEARETIFLKPLEDSKFVAVEANPVNPEKPARNVVYDDQTKVWHFADSDKKAALEIELSLGETFATIGGEQYQLHQAPDRQYEILITRRNGQQQYLPVYKEPISNNWYLKTANHHASFSPRQQALINTLRVPAETDKTYIAMNNDNPRLYGAGKIYQVATQDDATVLYNVVEMNGELLPVRERQLTGHEVQYEAYNLAAPADKSYRIEWDGERWILEIPTSPHICSSLRQYITPDMYAKNIDVQELSPPNQRGVRRNPYGRTFIKVNRHYVEIHQGKKMHKGAPYFQEIPIEYKNHQFHLAPDGVPPNFHKHASHSSATSQFYAGITADSKSVAPHYLSYKQIQNTTAALFPGEAITIRQIASADLNKRRYFFVRADDEYWFLETLPDGTHISLLGQTEQQRALEKFKERASGGSVKQIFTVRLKKHVPLGLEPAPQIIADITKKRIEAGWLLIKDILVKHEANNPQGNTLILGHDDFFGSTSFAKKSFAFMEDAYEKMIELFILLSQRHPKAIIAPGSISISQDIPHPYRENQNTYCQQGSEGELKNAVHFSANIAPVFHGGKIVAIARQGEYLTYHNPSQQAGQHNQSVTELRDLDHYIPRQSVLTVPNYWDHPHDAPIDAEYLRLGTIFAGKTLLPDERAIASRLLTPHLAPSNTKARADIQAIFSNEFMIGEDKFLLVIGDEFKPQNGFRSSVRNLALPGDDNTAEGNYYDWILQAAQEEPIDNIMCSATDNCLIVDHTGQTDFSSETTSRTPIREHFPHEDTIVYDYQID